MLAGLGPCYWEMVMMMELRWRTVIIRLLKAGQNGEISSLIRLIDFIYSPKTSASPSNAFRSVAQRQLSTKTKSNKTKQKVAESDLKN